MTVVAALPQPFTLETYARASADIEARFAALPSVVSLYRAGSVSAPGISDLDYLAIVEDGAPVDDIWPSLAVETRAVSMHTPFILDRETFRRHRWIAYVEPLEHRTGERLSIDPAPDVPEAPTVLAVEGLVSALLQMIKYSETGRLKGRALLCTLHGVRHDLRLAGISRAQAPKAWALVDEVAEVRSAWWEQPAPARRLEGLLSTGIAGVTAALAAVPGSDEPVNPLPLARAWRTTTLVAGPTGEPRRAGSFRGRLGTLSERRWARRRHRIAIPAPALRALVGPDAEEYRRERAALVRRYTQFVQSHGGGYSSLGFATIFASAS